MGNEMVTVYIDSWGYIVMFVMGVWDEYPGKLVLVWRLYEWTDVGDVEKGSLSESSGVWGVVE
jgi:hypothetical protein